MPVFRSEINALGNELGEKIMCEDCREDGDLTLWKVLYLALRKPRTRNSKEAVQNGELAIGKHLKDYPGHTVVVLDMKRKS